MGDKDLRFSEAIKGKKLPLLTIDNKYYSLIEAVGKTDEMEELQNKLLELLKAQGKANTEIKDIKKLKKKLMDEIVQNADENNEISEKEREKKDEENKRLINECNERIEKYEDDILDLPPQIEETNRELMALLMENCYELMHDNDADIAEISKWITQVRIELKKKLVRKVDKETKNQQIYSYMHDIFGPDVIEIFDMTYKGNK